jgi:acetyl-CoA carboxylase biotin carboxylase subunit
MGGKQQVRRVLIANRSEVARRIQQTCKTLGIQTVAVYTSYDAGAAYVLHADHAYQLSTNTSAGYLNQDNLLEIACRAKVDAVHPGYGFLSENAIFAQRVVDRGLTWIGPGSEHILLMGDKAQARDLMVKNKIPVVSGKYIALHEPDSCGKAFHAAKSIGFPVVLKDPWSGGGKGMCVAQTDNEFEGAFAQVQRFIANVTQSGFVLIEKFLTQARHIEVQVAGDGENYIHMYERECSIQRRNQKIIEEAPCLFVSSVTLEKMYSVALAIVKLIKYNSIGTIEFLVTPEEDFYFLEMNTRLQVEHGVTELTTGIDLVQLQFYIAQHGDILYKQHDIVRRGHAVECRLYAEDPDSNFMPSTGIIQHLELPELHVLRHDHDLWQGMTVSSYFDPMLSKLLVFSLGRTTALKNMLQVLSYLQISGIKTNKTLLSAIMQAEWFLAGAFQTSTLSSGAVLKDLVPSTQAVSNHDDIASIAAVLFSELETQNDSDDKALSSTENFWKLQQWR